MKPLSNVMVLLFGLMTLAAPLAHAQAESRGDASMFRSAPQAPGMGGAQRPAIEQSPAPSAQAPAQGGDVMLVDDFNDCEKPNALGGDFGAWDKDPSDTTQKCTMTLDKSETPDGAGCAVKVHYDVDSPNPAYNGLWMKLEGADLSQYQALSFKVKGDAAQGFSEQVKLELKNDKEVGKYVLKGITDQWQVAKIPIKDFAGLTDLSRVTEFVVVFDDQTASKQKTGILYLDDIAFER